MLVMSKALACNKMFIFIRDQMVSTGVAPILPHSDGLTPWTT